MAAHCRDGGWQKACAFPQEQGGDLMPEARANSGQPLLQHQVTTGEERSMEMRAGWMNCLPSCVLGMEPG